MGLTLNRSQLDEMGRVLVAQSPPMDPHENPLDAPKVVSLTGGASTFCLLLSVRLADGTVRTLTLNPVVARSVGRVCAIANVERLWWSDEGVWLNVPYSDEELATMADRVTDSMPPVPGMEEFQLAPAAVSVFGGSCPIGMLLKFRLADGSVVAWFLSPVAVFSLYGIIDKAVDQFDWLDDEGEFIVTGPAT